MSSSIVAIQNQCDVAIQKLEDVKQILSSYEMDSQKLQQDVTSLLQEKQSLAQEIVDMKQQVRDLGDELSESQNHVLTHVHITSDESLASSINGDKCFPEAMTEVTDDDASQTNEDDSMNVLNMSLDGTSVVSWSSSSVVHKKSRRNSKWYKSPKKWRRMMRSNRLQSILILD